MNSVRAVALLCLVALALGGCNTGKGVGSGDNSAQIRFINVIPDAGALNVTVDGNSLVTGLQFQQQTQYQSVNSGTHTYQVSANNGATNLISSTTALTGGTAYTYVIYGPASAATSLVINDSVTTPNGGTFQIRVLNAAAGPGPVDVYLTAPGADLTITSPNVGNVAYGNFSAFATVATGSYELRITAASTKEVIYDAAVQSFGDKASIELVAYSKASSKLVNVALLNIDAAGTGSIVDNLLAELKVVNATSVVSPLNIFVDGNLVLSNIPIAGVSNYQKLAAGTRNLKVEASTNPGATLLSIAPNLASATDTSTALTGTAGALSALILNDSNLPPAAGRARVRFVNTSPDLAAVDVFVNFSKQITGLATNSASSYLELTADAAGTLYEFDFNVTGTGVAVLKLPGVSLTAAKIYTIYVIGPAAALQGVVAKDN